MLGEKGLRYGLVLHVLRVFCDFSMLFRGDLMDLFLMIFHGVSGVFKGFLRCVSRCSIG